MSRIAYVNGRYVPHREARVHVEDRGYQFADGVYEVIAVQQGHLLDEKGHLDRLDHSLKSLRIPWPMSRRALQSVTREVIRRNRVRNGFVYMQITRGVARRDHAFPKNAKCAVVMTARHLKQYDAKAAKTVGVDVITIPDIRWERRDIKSVSLLPNILGKQQAVEAGAYEAWQIDDDGCVTEGTATNAWIVNSKRELITRDASHAILNGITRLAVLEVARKNGVTFVERPFTVEEAKAAREAFLTSSTNHVKAVTRIDGTSIGNGDIGELTTNLIDMYAERMERAGEPEA
ncbi:MAG: D-amino-acid transaminase [Rhodospirillales bacterium]|nr:D-amino-acid transaminase [Rhodospirillales bacterium]